MKKIKGMPISFDFGKLNKQADLIICDGPLLSHYATETGDQYLLYWLDADETCNRWMMIRTNLQILRKYVSKELPLYDILSHPEDEFVWIADLDNDLRPLIVQTLAVGDIPEEYMPERNAMYEFENDDPMLQGEINTYEINLPQKDSRLFKELITKMGWHASMMKLSRKIAIL